MRFWCAEYSAQDVAHSKSHKTIAAADLLKAIEVLELPPRFAQIMEAELERKYR
jgi:hypothetical protein